MPGKLCLLLSLCLLLPFSEAGRQMAKLSDKKLCADSECSREYSMRRAAFFFPARTAALNPADVFWVRADVLFFFSACLTQKLHVPAQIPS